MKNLETPGKTGRVGRYASGDSISVSYFRSKNWAFETPLPLGISINLPWGGHGYFLELHNQAIWSSIGQVTSGNREINAGGISKAQNCLWFPLEISHL